MEFHLVQYRKETNCHHDHIPLNLEGNGIIVFSVLYVWLDMSHIGNSESLTSTVLASCDYNFFSVEWNFVCEARFVRGSICI